MTDVEPASTASPVSISIDDDANRFAEAFARIAVDAGAVVMSVYREGARVRTKADSSPVCDADEQAELLIQRALARIAPGIPVVAEEAASRGDMPDVDGQFILVDPLDGTKEFLNRNGEFTVNIALVRNGTPTVGAVYAPALEQLWFAGRDAFRCRVAPGAALRDVSPIRTRRRPSDGLTVMASRSHSDSRTEAFLEHFTVADRRNAGSSLKFCAIAEGTADLYPRFGPTMEWDTAAGDAVLRAAGGIVLSVDGEPLRYGKVDEGFRNGGFVAWGDPVRTTA